jgi:type VI protein secretion system component Hcp
MQGGKPLDYLIWEFADVVISSHSYSGPSSEVPTEAISFRFGKSKVHYRAVKDDGQPEGALSGGWDLRKNQTWA